MSMYYQCDVCGHYFACDGCYAPSRPGDPVGDIDCEVTGCDGSAEFLCEGYIDEKGHMIEIELEPEEDAE